MFVFSGGFKLNKGATKTKTTPTQQTSSRTIFWCGTFTFTTEKLGEFPCVNCQLNHRLIDWYLATLPIKTRFFLRLRGGWTKITRKLNELYWSTQIISLVEWLPGFPGKMWKHDSPQRSYLFKGMTSYFDSATRIHSANLWTSNLGPCVGTSERWLDKKNLPIHSYQMVTFFKHGFKTV